MRFPLCLLFATLLGAADVPDPLLALPALPKFQTDRAPALPALTAVAPGIATTTDAVVLDGVTLFDQGPADGMEVVACLDGGKAHESLLRLLTGNGQLVKFAVIRVLGFDDGVGAPESSGIPARGFPVRLQLRFPDPDDSAQQVIVDVSSLVRDRTIDHAYPPLPFVYTGSRLQTLTETANDGKPVNRERFMLDTTKSVVVSFDEPSRHRPAPPVSSC
jgi:hypothetical protein